MPLAELEGVLLAEVVAVGEFLEDGELIAVYVAAGKADDLAFVGRVWALTDLVWGVFGEVAGVISG